jgi:uncharacterized FlaG/YvyC family protein
MNPPSQGFSPAADKKSCGEFAVPVSARPRRPIFPKELGMDVNALSKIAQALPSAATSIPADTVSENRQVIQAVKALNKSQMFGDENALEFERDPGTKRMVIKVVNRKTNDVVSQIPAEYILRLAEDLNQKIA